jgi:signal transduction histidine kinase
MLELVRGNLPEKIHFLMPRTYVIGRARTSDLCLNEPSISKMHARLTYNGDGTFSIKDEGSLHGIYINAERVQEAAVPQGAQIQFGNVTFRFSPLDNDGSTDRVAEFPWMEQQQLLLSLVQTLNSTLVLNQVLEQVLDAVMRITRAERGFLLLAEDSAQPSPYASVAGLRLRVGRDRAGGSSASDVQGISTSVVRKAVASGETVATGNAVADPSLGLAKSVILMDLRTIVCIPLRSPRTPGDAGSASPRSLGAIYVDNQETSAPFSAESLRTAEALARHAALAIENAQLFEREQRTIEELRQAQKRIHQAEKLATIGQMAAGIAHELNTPLTYIMGNLELLQSQGLTDRQKDMLGSVARGAERIKGLAHSLLAFSRPGQEVPTPVNVNDVIERSLELCHYQILKSGVQLEKALDPRLPAVSGLSNQLEMALINLVVNAIQAMGKGGRLGVASRPAEDGVEISVSDTGPGIPESIQATLFEPFITTKPEGQGTGLGLSTVLMVVERHDGRIDFTTKPGAGTTFRIRLPAAH